MLGVEIRGEWDYVLHAHIGGGYFGNDVHMPGEIVLPFFYRTDFKGGENPFVPLIKKTVEAAAFFGVFEELSFSLEDGFDKEAQALLDEAQSKFTDEDLTPTIEQFESSRQRHRAMDERARQRFVDLMRFVESQQADEDEDITAREAYERHEKGTQEMRRIVEGEEE